MNGRFRNRHGDWASILHSPTRPDRGERAGLPGLALFRAMRVLDRAAFRGAAFRGAAFRGAAHRGAAHRQMAECWVMAPSGGWTLALA